MNKYVAYYRVSVAAQSFDQQKKIVARYLKETGGDLVAEFEEVASGSVFEWPVFHSAVTLARERACPIVVATRNRVSRYEVDFKQIESQVLIVFADEL